MKITQLILALLISATALADENKPKALFSIGKDTVFTDEFIRMYNKNIKNTLEKRQTVDEYLELYITFKQKVADAKANSLDLQMSFINEYSHYKNQVLTNAIIDSAFFNNELINAYNRSKNEVNASHILISVSPDAPASDTLTAYNKIMAIRDSIVGGENFGSMAKLFSNDPSAKMNEGNLGYFGAFRMVFPFEKAAFETAKGDVSMPVRTRFGYHIIKINDIRPTIGRIKASHILLLTNKNMTPDRLKETKDKIELIYNDLKNGADFAELASKYSEDRGSAKSGGELPWFGSGRMVPEFEAVVTSLKKGNISEPFRTQYGWHIVKLTDREVPGTFDEERNNIAEKLSKTIGGEFARNKEIKKFIKQNTTSEDIDAVNNLAPIIDSLITDIEVTDNKIINTKILELNNKQYTVKSFINYIVKSKERPTTNNDNIFFVKKKYIDFKKHLATEMIKAKIEDGSRDMQLLLKEYYEGILMFNIMDKRVWSKASNDSTLISNFFERNKNKYVWAEVADADILEADGISNEDLNKIAAKCQKKRSKKEKYVAKYNKRNNNKIKLISYIKPQNTTTALKEIDWKEGISRVVETGNTKRVVIIHDIIKNYPKTITEAKGLMINDLQKDLEEAWISELKIRYLPKVNKDVLEQLKKTDNLH
jgi:peptidyl-prolyl cis-trans isomerase SurA